MNTTLCTTGEAHVFSMTYSNTKDKRACLDCGEIEQKEEQYKCRECAFEARSEGSRNQALGHTHLTGHTVDRKED